MLSVEALEPRQMLSAVPYATAGSNYTQNFDNLFVTVPANNTTQAATVLPNGWEFVESGANANTTLRVDNGSSGTGDTYLYGSTASNERAFGAFASGSLTSIFGASFVNNTGTNLSSFTLSYTGEQWKDGGSAAAILNTEAFSYSVGATSLTAGTYTNATSLNFTALVNNTSADATLDGNASANKRAISATVSGLTWGAGQTLYIRWSDPNDAGNDDGLGIDDLTFSAGSANTNPTIGAHSGTFLEGASAAEITTAMLSTTDAEQAASALTYTVSSVPANGGISKSGTPLAVSGTFTQSDINNHLITYTHDGSETTSDSFGFSVSDGAGGSATGTFDITVTPQNDNPTLTHNTGLSGVVFNTTTLITTSILQVSDVDNTPGQLTYTIGTASTGTVNKSGSPLTSGGTFTQADVDNGLVDYTAPASGSTDSLTFTVSDGAGGSVGSTSFTITLSSGNTAPTITHNTGLTLDEGATSTVTTALLQVTDAEQGAASLTYTVGTAPANGALKKSGTTLNAGDIFAQADVDNGLITYVHDGSETTSDSFSFTVSDGAGGSIGSTTFAIVVNALNDNPTLATNLGLTVLEGGSGTISSSRLAATDPDNTSAQLTYTVGTAPTRGTLFRNGAPLAANDTFTQADVDANLISYTHNGSETTSDSFAFTVSDGAGGSIGTTNFAITVTPVNDPPLITLNRAITVRPGQSVAISNAILLATDPDTLNSALQYSVTTAPTHGSLTKNGVAITSFTQNDLNASDTTANAIRYTTTGSPGDTDSITVSLTDGTTTLTSIVVNISIVAPGTASYTGGTYSQNFDNLLPTPIPNDASSLPSAMVLPLGWAVIESLANADSSIRIDNGSSGTGDTDVFGATGTNERAFGSFSSGSMTSVYGVALVNNSAVTYTEFNLAYVGEQWKDGGNGSAVINKLVFEYSTTATSLSGSGFTAATALDFTAPHNNTTADVALNGNDASNQQSVSATVTGLSWAPGQTLYLRWSDANDTGNDDGLAIDDLIFSSSNPNTSPVFTSTANPAVNENSTAVVTLAAIDAESPPQTVTFSITGGADSSAFSIAGGNQLVFSSAPDFEIPTDVGTDNVYEVQVTADDGAGGLTVQNLSVTVNPLNDNSPVFTSSAAPEVNENSTAVVSLAATDADQPSQTVTFSITGGADSGEFSITGGSQLVFNSAPNYENPTDAGTNNVYEVQVTADDGAGGLTIQNLTVTVDPLSEGDYNHDGVVDAADYTVWRDNLGAVVANYDGADGDGDGIVNQGDYDVWRANFGSLQSIGGSGSSGAEAIVWASEVDVPAAAKTDVTPLQVTATVSERLAVRDLAFAPPVISVRTDSLTDAHSGLGTRGTKVFGNQSWNRQELRLRDLLLHQLSYGRSQSTPGTLQRTGPATHSASEAAVDECFETLGDKVVLLSKHR